MLYLKGSINFGLCYEQRDQDECVGYPDSDWAGDINYRKSTEYLFQIGGAPVSWRSKKQSCVALSTDEADYMALANAAQEAMWMRQLIGDLNKPMKSIMIYEDNQSAIRMSKNPQFHGRSKHIGIK